MIELEARVAMQSLMNREYRRGLITHCVEDQRRRDVVSYLHQLGVARQDPVAKGWVQSQGPKLNDELGGYYIQ